MVTTADENGVILTPKKRSKADILKEMRSTMKDLKEMKLDIMGKMKNLKAQIKAVKAS